MTATAPLILASFRCHAHCRSAETTTPISGLDIFSYCYFHMLLFFFNSFRTNNSDHNTQQQRNNHNSNFNIDFKLTSVLSYCCSSPLKTSSAQHASLVSSFSLASVYPAFHSASSQSLGLSVSLLAIVACCNCSFSPPSSAVRPLEHLFPELSPLSRKPLPPGCFCFSSVAAWHEIKEPDVVSPLRAIDNVTTQFPPSQTVSFSFGSLLGAPVEASLSSLSCAID